MKIEVEEKIELAPYYAVSDGDIFKKGNEYWLFNVKAVRNPWFSDYASLSTYTTTLTLKSLDGTEFLYKEGSESVTPFEWVTDKLDIDFYDIKVGVNYFPAEKYKMVLKEKD